MHRQCDSEASCRSVTRSTTLIAVRPCTLLVGVVSRWQQHPTLHALKRALDASENVR